MSDLMTYDRRRPSAWNADHRVELFPWDEMYGPVRAAALRDEIELGEHAAQALVKENGFRKLEVDEHAERRGVWALKFPLSAEEFVGRETRIMQRVGALR